MLETSPRFLTTKTTHPYVKEGQPMADESHTTLRNLAATPRPLPIARVMGSGYMPVIYHPERKAEYLRFEVFARKTKATPNEALRYASRVIWYRAKRAADAARRLAIITGDDRLWRTA